MPTLDDLLTWLHQSMNCGEVDQARGEAIQLVRFCRATMNGTDMPGYNRPYGAA